MGRPLFSQALAAPAPTPTIVSAPEPQPQEEQGARQEPRIERWSGWNSFDPDSDEFFEGQNVVYEAFLDPADAGVSRQDQDGRGLGLVGGLRVDSPAEVSSSEDSEDEEVEERESPMATDLDDDLDMELDMEMEMDLGEDDEDDVDRVVERNEDGIPPFVPIRADAWPERRREIIMAVSGVTSAALAASASRPISIPVRARSTSNADLTRRLTTAPTSISDAPLDLTTPPSSPPNALSTSVAPFTPPSSSALASLASFSSSPSATPRIYSWRRPSFGLAGSPTPARQPSFGLAGSPTPARQLSISAIGSVSMSPGSTGGPLTNPGARRSLAHIAPPIVRV